MSTEFINDQWRLPNAWNGSESNVNKQSNYSMDFDIADYIDITATDTFDFDTNNFSISFWMKKDGNSGSFQPLVDLGGYSQSPYNQGTSIYSNTSNQINIWNRGSSPSNWLTSITTTTGWNHIVVVRNGDNLTVYINNTSSQVNQNFTGVSSINFGGSLLSRIAGTNSWSGKIDAVSIYNYALSSSQVTTLYGSSSTGIGNPMSLSPKPVAYYPLGDQDAFNGSNYLVPNSSLKDYVFNFDGNNTNIGYTQLNLGLTNSVSFWMKYNTSSTATPSIVNNYSITTSSAKWFILVVESSEQVLIRINETDNYYYTWNLPTGTLSGQSWHSFTFTRDNGETFSNYVKFYVDGVSLGSPTVTGATTKSSDATKIDSIGSDTNTVSWSQGLRAELSNFQIFNTALPATGSNSVETIYNNGSPLTSMSGFTSLVGWWKLDASATYDSSTGNWTIEDYAGSNDGTSSGMTQANLVQSDLSFTSGYSPYALEFDGTNDYINCNTSLNGMSSISYSCWIKPEQPSGNYGYIIAAGDYSPTDRMLSLGVSSGLYPTGPAARELFVYGGEGSGGGVVGKLGYFVTYGTWYHIAIVYTNNQDVDLYVNGNAEGSIQYNDTASISSGSPTRIGVYSGTLSNYFNGSISNVAIFNSALTSSQVTEIYSEGVPQNLSNHSAVSSLVSWWQLGSNSSFNTNWTVLDEKGSNNGTSVNMTEADIVDGVGSYANGLSSGMGGDEVIGDAPYSTANSLSVNMDVEDRVEDTPS